MARKRTARDRLQAPRDELQRAIARAEKGLSGASAEGFRELLKRVRQAVLESERLVGILDRLVRQGLRRSGSATLVPHSEVQDALREIRAAVGSLAATTPAKFSADYERYNQAAKALIHVGRAAHERGLEPAAKLGELDEWEPFRQSSREP